MSDAADQGRRRVRRAPHILCTWRDRERVVQSARRGTGVPASDLVLDLLDALDTWTDIDTLSATVGIPAAPLEVLLAGLREHALIDVETDGNAPPHRSPGPWAVWSPAAELFHLATRDISVARRVTGATPEPRPPATLAPRGATHVSLPLPRLGHASLRAALRRRRTHRRFGAGPVSATGRRAAPGGAATRRR